MKIVNVCIPLTLITSYLPQSDSKSIPDDLKQTLSAAVSISTKPISLGPKSDNVELEDADPDILEKKRQEIQKELELQLKMESRKAAAKEAALRKRKRQPSSSSSSSSSSDSESSSTSSSTSSSDERHKARKIKVKRHGSTSSSDELHAKKAAKKRMYRGEVCFENTSHARKLQGTAMKSKKRSMSPSPSKKQRASSSSTVMINSKGKKVVIKSVKISSEKHHRLREKEKEREKERELQLREREREKERERERERLRLREKERIRSRSPKIRPRSRSPKRLSRSREPYRKPSPQAQRRTSPSRSRMRSSSRPLSRRMDSRERERREKEKNDRETAREKERREALARCQERQRERERLAKEKSRRALEDEKMDRLLPRPAERAMALAAARDRSRESMERERHAHAGHSIEKEHIGSYARGYSERAESYDHVRRHDKEIRDHDREYVSSRHRDEENLRDGDLDRDVYDHRRDDRRTDYQSRNYIEEQRHRNDRENWAHEEVPPHDSFRATDRHHRAESIHLKKHTERESYTDSREWIAGPSDPAAKWESRKNTSWPQDSENWDRYKEDSWQETRPHQTAPPLQHERNVSEKPEHVVGSAPISKPIISVNRRWNSWRGRGRGTLHHTDFRRTNLHHHHEGFEERGEIYRRHINPSVQSGSDRKSNLRHHCFQFN